MAALSIVAKPNVDCTLLRTESLEVTEDQLAKYHQNLKDWMTNPPDLKESGRNRILMEEHREYLKQVFDSDAHPSQDKIKELADHTGIRMKSLQGWFKNRRSQNKCIRSVQRQKGNTTKNN